MTRFSVLSVLALLIAITYIPSVSALGISADDVSEHSVVIRWTKPTLPEEAFSKYELERSPVTGGDYVWQPIKLEGDYDRTSYKDTGLSPETSYAYRVNVYIISGGIVEQSEILIVKTSALRNPALVEAGWLLYWTGWALMGVTILMFLLSQRIIPFAIEIRGRYIAISGSASVVFLFIGALLTGMV